MNDISHRNTARSLTSGDSGDNPHDCSFRSDFIRFWHDVCGFDAFPCEILKINWCLTDNNSVDAAFLQDLPRFVDYVGSDVSVVKNGNFVTFYLFNFAI